MAPRIIAAVVALLLPPAVPGCSQADPGTAFPPTTLAEPMDGAGDPVAAAREHPTFGQYWYRGLAELDRYELIQARYGAPREGYAVLVFVTEDFLPGELVKHEQGPGRDAASVLKLNAWRRFDTGVYPYVVMTSVFQPVEPAGAPAWKLASTVTEWCGTVYQQLERRDGGYEGVIHSYFQGESDPALALGDAWLEEALFTTVRRDPGALPTGELRVVPAAHHLRMAHLPATAHAATGEFAAGEPTAEGPVTVYTLTYAELDRRLVIEFEAAFPHRILRWSEGPPADPAGTATTTAELTHSVLLDYWNGNGPGDDAYRALLGLQE